MPALAVGARSSGRGAEPAPRLRVGVDVVLLSLAHADTSTEGAASDDAPATDAPAVPHAYLWAEPDGLDRLPGVSLQPSESPAQAARRVLAMIGVDRPRHLEQLASFGDPDRVPGVRTLSVSHLALLPEPSSVVGDGHGGRWVPITDVDVEVGFTWDHGAILAAGLRRVRSKLSYSNIAYGLLPDGFTMTELQAVYEAVLGTTLDKRNFRRKVGALGLLSDTGRLRRGSHRPARLYTFTSTSLVLLDDVIATQPP